MFHVHEDFRPEINPGAFNHKPTICRIGGKLDLDQSLDILASGIPLFLDSTNEWVPVLALFHYTYKQNNHNNPLAMMFADLFCDNVPESARSDNALNSLVKSAQTYIGSMPALQPHWSKVTPANYEAALAQHPEWPTIGDPTVGTNGEEVKIEDLLQAWAYCFESPVIKIMSTIRSALWSMVLASQSFGKMTWANLRQTFAELSDELGYELAVIPEFPSVGENCPYLLLSCDARTNLLHSLAVGYGGQDHVRLCEIMEKSMFRCLPKLMTVAKAVIRFPNFEWHLFDCSDEVQNFCNHVNQTKVKRGKFTGLPGTGFWHDYDTLAYVANEILVRKGIESLVKFDFAKPDARTKMKIQRTLLTFDGESILRYAPGTSCNRIPPFNALIEAVVKLNV